MDSHLVCVNKDCKHYNKKSKCTLECSTGIHPSSHSNYGCSGSPEWTLLVYVVMMRRWGELETYCYLLGVFDTEQMAKEEAYREEQLRGGKYSAEINGVPLNSLIGHFTIKKAKDE